MAGNITIPYGKRVYIMVDGQSVVGTIPLLLEEDITLSVSSSFGPIMGGGDSPISKILTLGGSAIRSLGGTGFGGQIKQMGLQTWQSTDPLSLKFTFSFYLGINDKWDAEQEVREPIIKLMKLTLPEEVEGPLGVDTLVAPGPSPLDALKGISKEAESRIRSISVDVGEIIYLPEVIIKRVEPTFSKEVDDNGYPIWGKVSMDVQSLFTATGNILEAEPGEDRGAEFGRQ